VIGGHRTLIADDHPPLRRGVRLALEHSPFRVVAECPDGPTAVDEAARLRPQICLLDIHMPGDGIEAASAIHRLLPAARIVMLTVSAEGEDLFAAFRAGACGYLPKDTDPQHLPLALESALRGEAALPRSLVLRLIDEFRVRERRTRTRRRPEGSGLGLTSREWDVLDLLADGCSTAEIADELAITRITVRSHLSTIMKKLHTPDREAAVELVRDRRRAEGASSAATAVL
jgi:DNA-binding NarL/FixJ family response regulator